MARRGPYSLRTHAPWHVFEGFGASSRTASRVATPRSGDELEEVLARAKQEGLCVTFRGAGQSYGDAALNRDGLVVETRALDGIAGWNPADGLLTCGPGLTIEGVWRHTLADGYWPHVVPGTMRPTIGGCLSSNVHGKNNTRAGVFGDHVLDFDLVTPRGERLTCSRDAHADVFFAAIGGMGLLGGITRARFRLKRVETGLLQVNASTRPGLDAVIDRFEQFLPTHDYVVGWIDGTATGTALGRGELHGASHVAAADVADPDGTLRVDRQGLPTAIFGVPKSQVWRLVRPFMFDGGVRLINTLKYTSGRWHDGASYRQSHVAFAFLLDYVPDWRLAYGNAGFIQYQLFVPHADARRTLRSVLARCHAHRIPPYLAVLKRHRPDAFLLSHAVDGWSLAMDFPIRPAAHGDLLRLTRELTAIVLGAGGRFYFAKDSVLRPEDVTRAFGEERLAAFTAIKQRLDPDGMLTSELWRRVGG